MKILIITHSYYPVLSPRAFRWAAVAEYWANQGHGVDVLCSRSSTGLKYEVKNDVKIHRVGRKIKKSLKSFFFDNTQSVKTKKNTSAQAKSFSINRSKALNLIKWAYDYTWKTIYWPDSVCLWYFPAVSKAKQLVSKKDYDCIITVSHPFTGHLVGLNLKESNQNIRWIVDIGDPFCFLDETPVNNNLLYKKLNYAIEGKVFEYADAVSVTTEPTLDKYAQIFPENSLKIFVIPPLFLPGKNNNTTNQVFPEDDKIRMVFIGSLYKKIRNPKFLLNLFEMLLDTGIGHRLELHFFGAIRDCGAVFDNYQALLENKIWLHGRVEKALAIKAMHEADILINIGNDTVYQLPSKVVEYAWTGKPVINIAKHPNDSSTIFFNSYSPSLSLVENSDCPDSKTIDLIVEFVTNPPVMIKSRIETWLNQFRIEQIAASYDRLISK
jgi:glycosyltransferase involved in cell wall biosynthesis